MNSLSGLNQTYYPNTLDNLPPYSDFTGQNYLALDGSNFMLADLDMNLFNIKNLATATNNDEAVNLGQVNTALSNYVDLTSMQIISGAKFFGDITADGGLGVVRKDNTRTALVGFFDYNVGIKWAISVDSGGDNLVFKKDNSADVMTINYTSPSLSLNNYRIIDLATPINNNDATNKTYVDNYINSNVVTLTGSQTITGSKKFTSDIDMNSTNKIINCVDPTNNQDVATKNYVDSHLFFKTASKTGNFIYDDEDVIEYTMISNGTITFDNLSSYFTGKRFDILLKNWPFSQTLTFSIINGGSFPDGTTSKTYTITANQIKRYNCVIENITNNILFISDLTYL
jgi:hypothetical protein